MTYANKPTYFTYTYTPKDLKETFLRLCAWTTPYGHEAFCLHLMPDDAILDDKGNVHVVVDNPDGTPPRGMFASHMDTACGYEPLRVVFQENDGIISTDGTTNLGADCKIGVALMLHMIEAKVPGWYVFFVGEERGCIGSSWLARNRDQWLVTDPQFCISFDRYGEDSVITHQCSRRCCSDVFGQALAHQLNTTFPSSEFKYELDQGGIYTDSEEFVDDIPECTNISVGYDGHHTPREYQDIHFAEDLLETLVALDWNSLPIEREPGSQEYDAGGYEDYGFVGSWGSGGRYTYDTNTEPLDPTVSVMCDGCACVQEVPTGGYDPDGVEFCEECGDPLDVRYYLDTQHLEINDDG